MTQTLPSTPPPDVDITENLIRRLLRGQCPDLAGEPIRIMEAGWDNVMVRVGEAKALRLPRRDVADALIRNEQKWLPWLAPQLPLTVPAPIKACTPADYYPYYWSVQDWIDGTAADQAPPSADQAVILAEFLRCLHAIPLPKDAPENPVRDCPLSAKAEDLERRMAELERDTDAITPEIRRAWKEAVCAKTPDRQCFIAGDMHARNILTLGGRLRAIIDWGDMCAGDPATDFMSVWGLFEDKDARRAVIDHYGADDDFIVRAKGWAIFSGVILLHTGRIDTPRHARMGENVLRRITEDG